MDTEGIDALDANDTHDVRIFTLALLLSSAFLYNSVGAIDETAMQTLALMTRVTNSVKVQSKTEETTALGEHMPSFSGSYETFRCVWSTKMVLHLRQTNILRRHL